MESQNVQKWTILFWGQEIFGHWKLWNQQFSENLASAANSTCSNKFFQLELVKKCFSIDYKIASEMHVSNVIEKSSGKNIH